MKRNVTKNTYRYITNSNENFRTKKRLYMLNYFFYYISNIFFFLLKKKKGTRRCVHCPDPIKPDFDMAWGHIWAIMGHTTTRTHNSRTRRCDGSRGFPSIKSPPQKAVGGIRTPAYVVSTH